MWVRNPRFIKIWGSCFFNVLFCFNLFSYILDWFHNFNCTLLLGVLTYVSLRFFFLFLNWKLNKSFLSNFQVRELACSLLPIFILLFQMLPSLSLLYYFRIIILNADFSLKIVGHQWYWEYNLRNIVSFTYDSYILSSDNLALGEKYLLNVDNRCVLPINFSIRFCITSADVIHSWTLSNLFIKLDAISGVLRVFMFNLPSAGVYYGQCSEICGANHSFIPILLEMSLFELFKYWCITF